FRSPRSTLFLYTTLFRSGGYLTFVSSSRSESSLSDHKHSTAWLDCGSASPHTFPGHQVRSGCNHSRGKKMSLVCSLTYFLLFSQDRKSTRLNSSHVKISY